MPRPLLCLLAAVALAAVGCGTEPPTGTPTPANDPAAANDASTDFQPAACGKVTGLVTWSGSIPTVPPILNSQPRTDGSGHIISTYPHPYEPRIDRFTHAIGGAVVSLRGVNPARAKPWDLSPVTVEMRDSQIVVAQPPLPPGRVGFVRRGGSVSMQSREPVHHVLRGRGAAFFALPFPDPDQPLERTFDTCGRVELTSAAGYFWQAADLFVCDHPYYIVSDADGRFAFAQVPEGTYDLVVWHPNWVSTGFERNPETGLMNHLLHGPPLENTRPVTVTPGRTTFAPLNLPK